MHLLSCLNWLDSLTAHYPQNNTYRQSYGGEKVPFVLFIDPTFMYSNTKVLFLGMDVFLISQHAEHQAWQGNKGSDFAKWFLWFEASQTCLDSPAHTEGGIRDPGWFCQFTHALLKQFKSCMIPDPFLFQKLFTSLLEGVCVGKHLTQEVLTTVRDLEYQRKTQCRCKCKAEYIS